MKMKDKMSYFSAFFTAVRDLTRFKPSIPKKVHFIETMQWYPIVGLLLGAILVLAIWVLGIFPETLQVIAGSIIFCYATYWINSGSNVRNVIDISKLAKTQNDEFNSWFKNNRKVVIFIVVFGLKFAGVATLIATERLMWLLLPTVVSGTIVASFFTFTCREQLKLSLVKQYSSIIIAILLAFLIAGLNAYAIMFSILVAAQFLFRKLTVLEGENLRAAVYALAEASELLFLLGAITLI